MFIKDKLYAFKDEFLFDDSSFKKADGERLFFSKKVKIVKDGDKEASRVRVTNYRVCFSGNPKLKNFKLNELGDVETKKGFFCIKVFLKAKKQIVEFRISKKGYSKFAQAISKAYKYYNLEAIIGTNGIMLDIVADNLNKIIYGAAKKVLNTATKVAEVGVDIVKDDKKRAVAGSLAKGILSKFVK